MQPSPVKETHSRSNSTLAWHHFSKTKKTSISTSDALLIFILGKYYIYTKSVFIASIKNERNSIYCNYWPQQLELSDSQVKELFRWSHILIIRINTQLLINTSGHDFFGCNRDKQTNCYTPAYFFPQPWQTILQITTWRKSIDQDTVSPESLKTEQAKHFPDQKMRNTVSGELQFNTDIVIQPTREYT